MGDSDDFLAGEAFATPHTVMWGLYVGADSGCCSDKVRVRLPTLIEKIQLTNHETVQM